MEEISKLTSKQNSKEKGIKNNDTAFGRQVDSIRNKIKQKQPNSIKQKNNIKYNKNTCIMYHEAME